MNLKLNESTATHLEPEMVLIPGGTFLMGSPSNEEGRFDVEAQHEVTLSRFFLAKYPVTQTQWRAVAATQKVKRELDPDPSKFKGDNRPVEQVSWDDADEFCKRLSLHTGKRYRLPGEAQWEYACRAGTTTPFYFGNELTKEQANFDWTPGETTPVGQYPANAFGLYDMHGNVWEWCQDTWHGGTPVDGDNRVIRGGSWFNAPWYCRSAYRCHLTRVNRLNHLGFRVCCSAPSDLEEHAYEN